MRKLLSVFIVFTLLIGVAVPVYAADKSAIDVAVTDMAGYVYRTVKNPQVGSVGGEWALLGLARSGYNVPQSYYDAYYKTVEEYVKACKGNLDDYKYAEYSRVILGLTAAGFDPRNVGGYDLTVPLGDFDKTVWQGINGPIFALIALDSAGYDMPQNPKAVTQATREMYIKEILSRQLPDGGFALDKSQTTSDADITGMALQALAKYQDRVDVKAAIDLALNYLFEMNGGFVSWGDEGSESVVQAIIALCELGISVNDTRFVKNGYSLLDKLMEYYVAGKGFERTIGGGVNQMTTEQALCALAALYRLENGLTSLYDMSDVNIIPPPKVSERTGLPGKHEDIRVMPVTIQGKTFSDIAGHENQAAIEALSARSIISGKSETQFDPDATMTRAEFATIVSRGLGLPQSTSGIFNDVRQDDWFFGYVGAAYKYSIVNGTSATTFNPNGIIIREEAATMVAQAAKLCGLNTKLDDMTVHDMLAQFNDYITVSDWARNSMAFCYKENILSQDVFDIKPKEVVKRGEIAEMLYRMLSKAELL